jgi:hypothetical protein
MLGMFSLFPLLKGWEYKMHKIVRTVEKGKSVKLSLRERGWLMTFMFSTTDCYGTVQISWQGADLQTQSFPWNAELFKDIGAFAQDPSGWVQRYSRPNPFSTAGLYYVVPYSGYAQGSVLPYVPTITLEASLPAESTQESAYFEVWLFIIAITDAKAFIRSLRRLLDAKALLEIDPSLLAFIEG